MHSGSEFKFGNHRYILYGIDGSEQVIDVNTVDGIPRFGFLRRLSHFIIPPFGLGRFVERNLFSTVANENGF